ncbi:nucleoside diphosphate-linked moiety X motif 17-like isoform X2 [Mizuhopecten yessoensis]|nr:nucleoside diphosphate-linked moiety X motif 17-like isoform X2 [Mizuhopecten yessoensis]XP_021368425.1 nucleoside diphosphate-linked moiety X motif 17-like isoform X2 [Mizuhopecten yessoensis]
MAASGRILVYLKRKGHDHTPTIAKFTQSVLDCFVEDKSINQSEVFVELVDNHLIVTDDKLESRHNSIKIRRPSFCPIHNLRKDDIGALPEDILNRGIDVGAAVILESADNKILLTRRSKSLRTFPGIWVPPGGHVEKDETFIEAGLRELHEETGLKILPSQCVGGNVQILALWESVFPPKLTLGLPKRHHVVVYLYGKLTSDLTSDVLTESIQLQPEEAEACVWLDRKISQDIVARNEEEKSDIDFNQLNLPDMLKGLIIRDEDKKQVTSDVPLRPLFNTSSDTSDGERVSTGTKFALEEWLNKTSKSAAL